jgi:nicotinamide mononucleotide transporter
VGDDRSSFSRLSAIFHEIVTGALNASRLEQAATVLGVIFVLLAMRESLWNFPVGLVQAALSGWVFFQGKLYSDAVLQVIFFAAMIYGWWHWGRGTKDEAALAVQRLSLRGRLAWSLGTLAVCAAWGAGMATFTDAALPWWDGFIFAASVTAQWLQSRKILENWHAWIITNTVAIGVYWSRGFYWFAVLYFIFWLLAWGGLRAWRESWRRAHG